MKDIFKKCIIWVLTLEAKLVLKRFKPVVIAVTGSVGKTSTKDATYTILHPHMNIIRNEKSFNGDIGVPLSILELPNAWNDSIKWIQNCISGLFCIFKKKYASYVILEVGADKPHDISKIAKWIKPKYSIFTRFPEVPVHVEFFDSKEQVIKEKKSLARFTRKSGTLILNADDPKVMLMQTEFKHRVKTYGENQTADIRLSSFAVQKKNDHYVAVGTVLYKSFSFHFELPGILAKTQILSALPGILIGVHEGYTFTELCDGINTLCSTQGRLSQLFGVNSSIIIDDTYNSSPVAVVNALDVIKSLPEVKRRIVVLGDMMELGHYAEEEHRKIGMYAAHSADILVTVGSRSKFIHDEAVKHNAKDARWFDSTEKAGEFVRTTAQKGDVILFKASQSPRLEKAVKMCLRNQSDSIHLVRQDEEWAKR
jgi:UDP-N-acetylmuramoyl-tripeptide--D-alanyl-D-alanine ligase